MKLNDTKCIFYRSVALREFYKKPRHHGVAGARVTAGAAPYALVLLDRRLREGDGLSAIPDLRRAHPAISTIILTAPDAIESRVAGLDRPFSE